ncbi:MAG: Pvc16 family protein [Leptolyngbyaceae cyanobacterium bins.349]|nr:Pvc16 family protein [Leptolyngbyaceae cyanobacterium bins.349]
MISAASQTLAELLTQELAQISQEQISFEHPRLWQKDKPGLNLYCYHVQEVDCVTNSNQRWFELTFLISATDYTSLGEQSLLSNVLMRLSQYPSLPEAVLDQSLRGFGAVGMRVFTQALAEDVQFWAVLRTPLQLALHVTLTVPYPMLRQAGLVS